MLKRLRLVTVMGSEIRIQFEYHQGKIPYVSKTKMKSLSVFGGLTGRRGGSSARLGILLVIN